jgi:hypothetical protein
MSVTDTSERCLERLISEALVGAPCGPDTGRPEIIAAPPATYRPSQPQPETVARLYATVRTQDQAGAP